MTRLGIGAPTASTLQAAVFHQGLNRCFFVMGRQYLSKIHGCCPLHRICSTDRRKDAKFLMLLRCLGIPTRSPKKLARVLHSRSPLNFLKFSESFGLKHLFLETFHQNSDFLKNTVNATYTGSFRTSYSRCSVTTRMILSIKALIWNFILEEYDSKKCIQFHFYWKP